MTVKAFLTVWEGDEGVPRKHLGEYKFRMLPRIGECITIRSSEPWQDVLLILNVEHHALEASTPEIGRYDPSIEIFVRLIGEHDCQTALERDPGSARSQSAS